MEREAPRVLFPRGVFFFFFFRAAVVFTSENLSAPVQLEIFCDCEKKNVSNA